jgi:hypothetical protein
VVGGLVDPVVPVVQEVLEPVGPVLSGVVEPLRPVAGPVVEPLGPGRGSSGGSSTRPPSRPAAGPGGSGLAAAPAPSQAGSFGGFASLPPAAPPVQVPSAPTVVEGLFDSSEGPLVAAQHLVLGMAPYDLLTALNAGLNSSWATGFQLPISVAPFTFSAAAASPDAARAPSGSLPGSGQLPASGGAAGSAAAGIASSALFALLVAFTAFALWHLARLMLTPARWRPQAFVAVLERPG